MPDVAAVFEVALVAAVALGGYVFARRYGGGAALEQLERANKVLEDTVRNQEAQITRLQARVSELEGKTDLTIALVPVLEALKHHDTQAETRSAATLGVLHQIAGMLGPELG